MALFILLNALERNKELLLVSGTFITVRIRIFVRIQGGSGEPGDGSVVVHETVDLGGCLPELLRGGLRLEDDRGVRGGSPVYSSIYGSVYTDPYIRIRIDPYVKP